ncbi:MAG: hypothetical protein SangKO_074080 [Sandaracinaceae bacterium]
MARACYGRPVTRARTNLVFAITLAAFSATAAAQEVPGDDASVRDETSSADARARAHFQEGTELFQSADYQRALEAYTRAYELSGRIALAYNLYLCHERLGNLEEATRWLERYLAGAEEVHRAGVLRERLATMWRRLEDEAAASEAPTEAASDAGDGGEEPLSSPGPDPAPTQPSGFEMPSGALVGFGVGGAGAIGLALFGGLALGEDAALTAECMGACPPERVGQLEGYMIAADTSLGFAIAGAAVGVVWTLIALATQGDASASR